MSTTIELLKEEFTNHLFAYYKGRGKTFEANLADHTFYSSLLLDENNIDEHTIEFETFKVDLGEKHNYPTYPLYKTLAFALLHFIVCDEYPISNQHLENVSEISVEFKEEFYNIVIDIKELLLTDGDEILKSHSTADDFQSKSILLFCCLDKAHILKFLGISKTVGSLESLPPTLRTLWESFNEQHHPKSKLTVAARALSKHCHRSSDVWWGDCTGKESDKNQKAISIFTKIFRDICWINIHTLPHSVYVLELRCSEWYGLRWSHDGKTFRGFLEPQMLDGHEKNWKH